MNDETQNDLMPVTDPIAEIGQMACSIPGCRQEYKAAGFCQMHYTRQRKGADMNPTKGVNPRGTAIERFMKKVKKYAGPKGECWEFTGAKREGYGAFSFNGVPMKAHRFSWEYHNNRKIPDKLFILHSCDFRPCVNPKHLSPGTHQQNMNEMWERNPIPQKVGQDHHAAKLTSKDVLFIYIKTHSREMLQKELAKMFDVTVKTIQDIKSGNRWQHVTRHGQINSQKG